MFCVVSDLQELWQVWGELHLNNLPHATWCEPDMDNLLTGIAAGPFLKHERPKFLKHLRLFGQTTV